MANSLYICFVSTASKSQSFDTKLYSLFVIFIAIKLKLFLKEWMHHQDDNTNVTEYHQIDDITIIGVKI